jgi:hypothetical protein
MLLHLRIDFIAFLDFGLLDPESSLLHLLFDDPDQRLVQLARGNTFVALVSVYE